MESHVPNICSFDTDSATYKKYKTSNPHHGKITVKAYFHIKISVKPSIVNTRERGVIRGEKHPMLGLGPIFVVNMFYFVLSVHDTALLRICTMEEI